MATATDNKNESTVVESDGTVVSIGDGLSHITIVQPCLKCTTPGPGTYLLEDATDEIIRHVYTECSTCGTAQAG